MPKVLLGIIAGIVLLFVVFLTVIVALTHRNQIQNS